MTIYLLTLILSSLYDIEGRLPFYRVEDRRGSLTARFFHREPLLWSRFPLQNQPRKRQFLAPKAGPTIPRSNCSLAKLKELEEKRKQKCMHSFAVGGKENGQFYAKNILSLRCHINMVTRVYGRPQWSEF